MSKIIFTRGLPGSGKTTWAKDWVNKATDIPRMNVNRDDIRAAMGFSGVGTPAQESAVTDIHSAHIKTAIDNGFEVIVSDTNLRVRFVKEIVRVALTNDYEVEFQDFPMNLDDLFKRNKNRPIAEQIDEDRIRDMYMKFPTKNWQNMETVVNDVKDKIAKANESSTNEPFINNQSMPKAILVDIDGTIAHKSPQRNYYDYDERVKLDFPDHAIIDMVNTYYDKGYKIIVMSGREDKCKTHTIEWLYDNNVQFHEIHMRAENDMRPDWIVKDELVRAHIENIYYIEFCLDDRNQVVNHYRRNGFKVLQVEPGDF